MADEQKPDHPATDRAAAPAGAAPARPAAPRPGAPPVPDLGGKTTTAASAGGAAARAAAAPSARTAASGAREPDDTSPLFTRRAWMSLAWGAFSAASAAAPAATRRVMFPNVLNEPPQQFKIGLPSEYGEGVDERWKDRYAIWVVRTADDIVQHASGFYALLTTCTHLGCTP